MIIQNEKNINNKTKYFQLFIEILSKMNQSFNLNIFIYFINHFFILDYFFILKNEILFSYFNLNNYKNIKNNNNNYLNNLINGKLFPELFSFISFAFHSNKIHVINSF